MTLIVAVVAGGALLFPSLGLLFGLLLSGRFDEGTEHAGPSCTGAAGVAAGGRPRAPAAAGAGSRPRGRSPC